MIDRTTCICPPERHYATDDATAPWAEGRRKLFAYLSEGFCNYCVVSLDPDPREGFMVSGICPCCDWWMGLRVGKGDGIHDPMTANVLSNTGSGSLMPPPCEHFEAMTTRHKEQRGETA